MSQNARYDGEGVQDQVRWNRDGKTGKGKWWLQDQSVPFSAFVFLSLLGSIFFLLALLTTGGFGNTPEHENEPAKHNPSTTKIPDYFQTSPQRYAGPTRTADIAPFLAQTNVAPYATSYTPNLPLETSFPVSGYTNGSNIFQLMGHLSPYAPNPDGFGVDEYHLPPGAKITHAHLVSRHGSRYPTSESSVSSFANRIFEVTQSRTAEWSGELGFLNDWRYTLGAEILVARGRQELFDSGILFYYNYGHLYSPATKLIARTTTQDRMLKSAEYFMTGFFGLDWPQNVTLEPVIEQPDFNNSLAGYFQCKNSGSFRSNAGNNASVVWQNIYLKEATDRLNKSSGNYEWTVQDSYNAQILCPYETVAYGYSRFCELFTYEEWQGFEYSVDLQFQGNDGSMSPTGRAVGIGYVEELYARLQGHLYDLPSGSTNVNETLDEMEETFPLHQNLYMDFSHDTNIYSILTALGLRQFNDQLSNSSITPGRNVTVSHITPFGARVVLEQITAPRPVKARRPTKLNAGMAEFYVDGTETKYIHLTISQRTVPLGYSYPECGIRDDGWCELDTFMKILGGLLEQAKYEFSCFGNYEPADWGEITDGVPHSARLTKRHALGMGMGSGLQRSRNSDVWYDVR